MSERRMRFRIGLFVLVTLLLLAGMIAAFGAVPSLFRFKNATLYTVTFPDAPGVHVGTPVRRCGVRIGEVEQVDLDGEKGEVRVALRIDRRYPVRRNEQPTLNTGLITGDTAIDFVVPQAEGKKRKGRADEEPVDPADRRPIDPGQTLAGIRPANVSTLLNRASEVVPTTQETLNEIRKSIQRFEELAPLIEQTLRQYRDLAKETREMLPELEKTNKEIRDLAKSAREFIPDLRKTNDEAFVAIRNWGRLGEHLDVLLQENRDKLVKALENLNETMVRIADAFNDENRRNLNVILRNTRAGSERLPSISQNTDELVKESRQTLKRSDEVMQNLQKATKPAADRNESIFRNLDESSVKLNRTLSDAQELLKAMSQSEGTLGKLLADPSLYHHLDDAACILARSLPRLDRVLHDLEVFADKLARHPEALGLGGVVKPSSGLKEAPSSYVPRPPH